ncbi:methyl-accepting chemotaxis protein [Acuticoccus mangrovi]|uniref:PAS domain-containing methyl-accepting chemotaxis protein n=1 Tax=Acuticoccus mangrovi TaxID=2796142 RepID=A0A934IRD0_9HYPH|nr:PAS domain-containing methyl-accepting chemotaxis protein [Acuticoccus mangrovi]MBJ3778697.1 PAS domain-containing methyl-accepting chemotaxis protein [Acuticoccus mangrovi]
MTTTFFEKALSRAERTDLMRAAGAADAVLIVSTGDEVRHANEQFLKIVGFSAGDIVGKSASRLIQHGPGESSRMVDETITRALKAGKPYHAVRRLRSKDGGERFVDARFYLVGSSDRSRNTVIISCIDVTDSFQQSDNRRIQLDTVDKLYAIIEFDFDSKILSVNDNFCQTMRYRRDELIGRSHRIFLDQTIMTDDEYRQFWKELKEGRAHTDEFKRLRKDGTPVYLQATYSRVLDAGGRPCKVIKIAVDITERVLARKKAEEVAGLIDDKLQKIAGAVANANERSTTASSAASQTTATVEHATSAVQEFEVAAQRIADTMVQSRQAVGNVLRETETADKHISQLSDAASSMTSIVEIIQKVAGQINLLALNATIEAARAGESGKGFAVVAAEVKSLADQVEKSTNQISADIERVQSVSGDVVNALRHIVDSLTSVQESVNVAADAVESQTTTARDIASGMRQAAASVREIDQNLGQISLAIADADGSAREGSSMYRSLQAAALH